MMKFWRPYYPGAAIILVCCLSSCHSHNQIPPPPLTQQQVSKDLIRSHRMYIKQENDEIVQYIKRHNYTMQGTSTGIYYMIYRHGNGQQPVVGDYATVSYSISLLDGTLCYDSKKDGPKRFRVGEDIEESGVHQAVEMMHTGDEGLFIIPSNLAQGLVGDRDKIPPGAVVIYDIHLLAVSKPGVAKQKTK